RLARHVLRDGHGALPYQRDGHGMGADAMARDPARRVGRLAARGAIASGIARIPRLVLELLETGGEPGPVGRAPDEKYRTRAAVRGRRQDAVDPEVAVRLESDTHHRICVALHKGSRGFTN